MAIAMADGMDMGGVKTFESGFRSPSVGRTGGLYFVRLDALPARAVPMKPTTFPPRGVCIREETQGQVEAAASKSEAVYCAQTSVFAGSSMVGSEEVR